MGTTSARPVPAVSLPVLGVLRPARMSPPTRHSILRGIMVFRWLAGLWAIGVFLYEVYDRNHRFVGTDVDVARPWAGATLCGALLAFLVAITLAYRRNPDSVLRPRWVVAEISLAAALSLLDVWVYGSPDHSQALPTVWPVAAIATVALAAGRRAGVLTGVGFGVARYVGWLPFNDTPWSLTRISSLVLMAIAGWTAAYLFERLEQADQEISSYRAREEVARTLHDGVLQTLAVIQRRSDDAELVALARRQEHDLRGYLFAGDSHPDDLATSLRTLARTAEEMFGLRIQVVCAPDLPAGSRTQRDVLSGAVREALNNAGKHADADQVVIYAEPDLHDDRRIAVSVKDNGRGFEPSSTTTGQGISRSILGRVIDAGGRARVDGRPGKGTEVQLWL